MNIAEGGEGAHTYISQAYPELGKGLVTMTAPEPGEKRDGPAQALETHLILG